MPGWLFNGLWKHQDIVAQSQSSGPRGRNKGWDFVGIPGLLEVHSWRSRRGPSYESKNLAQDSVPAFFFFNSKTLLAALKTIPFTSPITYWTWQLRLLSGQEMWISLLYRFIAPGAKRKDKIAAREVRNWVNGRWIWRMQGRYVMISTVKCNQYRMEEPCQVEKKWARKQKYRQAKKLPTGRQIDTPADFYTSMQERLLTKYHTIKVMRSSKMNGTPLKDIKCTTHRIRMLEKGWD